MEWLSSKCMSCPELRAAQKWGCHGRSTPLWLGLWLAAGLATSAAESDPAARLLAKKNEVQSAPAVAPKRWQTAEVGAALAVADRLRTGDLSKASVRLADLSVLQLDELTTIEIVARRQPSEKPVLDVQGGQIYFFSRDRPAEVQIQSPVVTGALQGTEFNFAVERNGRTTLTMLDGEVELSNRYGRVRVGTGEQGVVEPGSAPVKTSVIDTTIVVQWCLYYPGVLDVSRLALPARLAPAAAAYGLGDLPGALRLAAPFLRRRAGSADERAFRAALLLSAGRVAEADRALRTAGGPPTPDAQALRRLIAAVTLREFHGAPPERAPEWLAESYYRQARGDLPGAREAARQATQTAPDLGFAWVRLAEVEFSFGRIREATAALESGRRLSPRNAQAAALAGFFASARNQIKAAEKEFDLALALDPFLGNAWLGRGLCAIRRGDAQAGRRDLQMAAALEPNRALLHSYLGKAFANAGAAPTARRELARSLRLDPADPTAWLYRALLERDENELNAAVASLEESLRLNDNRALYRSRLLLDQDRAVRGTNLAAIYDAAGLTELSERTANRAAADDFANGSAHLFLANSDAALRDRTRIRLRFDTAFFNELLLARLLAPVGGGSLSQSVSQQEYSKLFEAERFGLSTDTTYRSTGGVREISSLYGRSGNLSFAVDGDYEYDRGTRPNNDLNRLEIYAQAKYQFTPADSLFLQLKYQNNRSGDVFQYFDPAQANATLRFQERQSPLVFLGYHREWGPQQHTLFILSRLDNDQTLTAGAANQLVIVRDAASGRVSSAGTVPLDLAYHSRLRIWSAELNHIWQGERLSFSAGVRMQFGTFDTTARFDRPPAALSALFLDPAADQAVSTDYRRIVFYGYGSWRLSPALVLSFGGVYDALRYPTNYRNPPLLAGETEIARFLPKAGLIARPWQGAVLRAAYTRSLGGVSVEDSVRLEPTSVAGFNQAQRTLISESLVGSVDAALNSTTSLGLEQKLGFGTYLSVEAIRYTSDVRRETGVFEARANVVGANSSIIPPLRPGSTTEKLGYEERNVTLGVRQLLAQRWTLGGNFQWNRAALDRDFPRLEETATLLRRRERSTLRQANLFVLYNDPTGWFGRVESVWISQRNAGVFPPVGAGDDFWQYHVSAGFRLKQGRGSITISGLNLSNRNYRLQPLNPYDDPARSRTLAVRVRLNL